MSDIKAKTENRNESLSDALIEDEAIVGNAAFLTTEESSEVGSDRLIQNETRTKEKEIFIRNEENDFAQQVESVTRESFSTVGEISTEERKSGADDEVGKNGNIACMEDFGKHDSEHRYDDEEINERNLSDGDQDKISLTHEQRRKNQTDFFSPKQKEEILNCVLTSTNGKESCAQENASQIENYESDEQADLRSRLGENGNVFAEVDSSRNDVSLDGDDLQSVPEDKNDYFGDEYYESVTTGKEAKLEEVSEEMELSDDELNFSHEDDGNAEVPKGDAEENRECSVSQNMEKEQLCLDRGKVVNGINVTGHHVNGNGEGVNECTMKTEGREVETQDNIFDNIELRKVCGNLDKEIHPNITREKFDENERESKKSKRMPRNGKGNDGERKRNTEKDDQGRIYYNLPEKGDRKFEENEEELFKGDSRCLTGREMDEKQNNSAEEEDDLRETEDKIKKDDNSCRDVNEVGYIGGRCEIGKDVNGVHDSFKRKNGERMNNDLRKREDGNERGDNVHQNDAKNRDDGDGGGEKSFLENSEEYKSLQKEDDDEGTSFNIKNEEPTSFRKGGNENIRQNEVQNGEDNVQNDFIGKRKEQTSCDDFTETTDDDQTDDRERDLITRKRIFQREKEIDFKRENFAGSDVEQETWNELDDDLTPVGGNSIPTVQGERELNDKQDSCIYENECKFHDQTKNGFDTSEYKSQNGTDEVQHGSVSENDEYYSKHQKKSNEQKSEVENRTGNNKDEDLGDAEEQAMTKSCSSVKQEKMNDSACIDGNEMSLIPHGNENNVTAEEIAPENIDEDVVRIYFRKPEQKPNFVFSNNALTRERNEILHGNHIGKGANNINLLLPHRDKTSFKSTVSLISEEREMIGIEQFDFGESDFSNESVESEFSADHLEQRTESQVFSEGSDDLKMTETEEDGLYGLEYRTGVVTIFFAFLSVVGYVGDLISDLVVSYIWYRDGHPLWFGLSLSFAIVPTVILNCINYIDMKNQRRKKRTLLSYEEKPWVWKITVASHFLLLGPFFRYLRYFLFTLPLCNEMNKMKHSKFGFMLIQVSTNSFEKMGLFTLDLAEGFMESAPQLILQIYTMLKITDESENKTRVIAQVASISFSLFKLSWSVTNFQITDFFLSNVNISSIIFHLVWQMCIIVSRMVSIALFTTIFPITCLIVCCCHAAAAIAWVTYHKCRRFKSSMFILDGMLSHIYGRKLGPVVPLLMIGVIQVFCYFDMTKIVHWKRLLTYYSIVGVQNSVFITLWFLNVDGAHQWIHILALAAVFVCFVLGILLMIVFHRCFHANVLTDPDKWKLKILYPEKREKYESKDIESDKFDVLRIQDTIDWIDENGTEELSLSEESHCRTEKRYVNLNT